MEFLTYRILHMHAVSLALRRHNDKYIPVLQRSKGQTDKCTLQDKKKSLNALDVQTVAIPQKMKIRISIPLEFITTA
jgi:hypothetical protein